MEMTSRLPKITNSAAFSTNSATSSGVRKVVAVSKTVKVTVQTPLNIVA